MEENQNSTPQNMEPQFNHPPTWSRGLPKGLQMVLWIFVVTALLAGGFMLYAQNKIPEPVACMADAKLCPDGSYVGRVGPNCEFAECPTVKPVEENKDYDNNQVINLKDVDDDIFDAIPSEKECVESGGVWTRVNLRGDYGCSQSYPDGNKSCTSSSECDGLCIITTVEPELEDAFCQNTSRPLGCYISIEDFKAGKSMACQ